MIIIMTIIIIILTIALIVEESEIRKLKQTHKQELAQIKREAKEQIKEATKAYKAQIDELKQKHAEQVAKIKKSGQKTSKEKTKRAEATILTPEEIKAFHKRLEQHQGQLKELLNKFPYDARGVLERLDIKQAKFVEQETKAECQLAATLAGIVERGALRSMREGAVWRSHRLEEYSVEGVAELALRKAKCTVSQIKMVFGLLHVAIPRSRRTKQELLDTLIKEIAMRANTR